jgi:hypothetical protein
MPQTHRIARSDPLFGFKPPNPLENFTDEELEALDAWLANHHAEQQLRPVTNGQEQTK